MTQTKIPIKLKWGANQIDELQIYLDLFFFFVTFNNKSKT